MNTALVSKLTKLVLAAVLLGSVISTSNAAGLTNQAPSQQEQRMPFPPPTGADDGTLP